MKNKTILITGGAGFIGKNLSEMLAKDNRVIVLDKRSSITPGCISITEDIRKKKWINIIGKVDYIFHCASVVGVDYVAAHPEETRATEIMGMRNLIEYAKKAKPERIVYASTSSVYDVFHSPTSYNTAKLFAEQLLRESGLNWTITRLFNVYGKHQEEKMVVERFISLAKANRNIAVYGDGKQTRDFSYIDDVAKAMVAACESIKTERKTFDIGTGKETQIAKLAKIIIKATGSSSKIIYTKPPKDRLAFEILRRSADVNPAKRLGISCATKIEEGIKNIININILEADK